MTSLADRKVLITGSSRGIGRAFATELALCGADVAVHYHADAGSAESLRQEIAAMGRNCLVVRADLSEPDGADKIAAQLSTHGWGIDILVLNASVQIRKPWPEIQDEDFHGQINANVLSAVKLLQRLVPHMQAQKWGRIITIGSIHEVHPNPDMLVYAASKAAVTLMAKSLAVKLAPDGITVNSLGPGVILTDRNADALKNREWHDRVCSRIPLGDIGRPQDCAGILALLCSDEGRYISGQNIFIDGAFSAA